MSSGTMQAKDLDDAATLRTVEASCVEFGMWTTTLEVERRFTGVPPKVVAAKLSKLLKRGLVTGCDCGCRGDWELTTKGRELAGITTKFRDNPCER